MTGESAKEDDGSTLQKFFRNTAASMVTFTLDLVILWTLVEIVELPRVLAAAIAFIIPLVVFYFLQREWVFPQNDRSMGKGLALFALSVAVGFTAMLATFWALLELTELHYILARILASVVYGLLLFYLNGKFNFRDL